MYARDHQPAHFHARYGDDEVLIEIETSRVLRGMLPRRGLDRRFLDVAETMTLEVLIISHLLGEEPSEEQLADRDPFAGEAVADQPATDHGPGEADPAPAVHIHRAAPIESVVDGVEDCGHPLSAPRGRHVAYRMPLIPAVLRAARPRPLRAAPRPVSLTSGLQASAVARRRDTNGGSTTVARMSIVGSSPPPHFMTTSVPGSVKSTLMRPKENTRRSVGL